MTADLAAVGVWLLAYLCGAVPVGYLAGRLRGVNLFEHGSRNVGATNAARVLGTKAGAAVFLLDFLKGAAPVAVAPWLAGRLGGTTVGAGWLAAGAVAAAFLGHLYPATLGFRGGKGVATGAGTVCVLAPGPALAAVGAWLVVALAARTVSVASVAAVAVLAMMQAFATPDPSGGGAAATAYCVAGAALVAAKHRANLLRVWAGTENTIRDSAVRHTLLAAVHALAAGLWFGGAAFFSFAAAPAIFGAFADVVATAPSDRTANVPIVPPGTPDADRQALASALAGAAVGPVFPRFFGVQLVCALVALVTALPWRGEPRGRLRVAVLAAGLVLVVVSHPVSGRVSALRAERFSPDPAVSAAAKAAFGPWHVVSLGLSAAATGLAGAGLALAGVRRVDGVAAGGYAGPR